eukprot:GHVU01056030.1.p2 GENE.GHVU01056030.1~~GHVU01056030.1.p2  ORF type:complete len:111 (+),score=2.21 GHVU01056030.1:940-1272(+)
MHSTTPSAQSVLSDRWQHDGDNNWGPEYGETLVDLGSPLSIIRGDLYYLGTRTPTGPPEAKSPGALPSLCHWVGFLHIAHSFIFIRSFIDLFIHSFILRSHPKGDPPVKI